jgi:hypothetical protein
MKRIDVVENGGYLLEGTMKANRTEGQPASNTRQWRIKETACRIIRKAVVPIMSK